MHESENGNGVAHAEAHARSDDRIRWLGILPHSPPFGLRWQDEVYGIGTVVLEVDGYTVKKITVYPRQAAGETREALVADEHRRVVQLIEREFVTEVAVRRNKYGEIWGVQIVTNKRAHPWAGNMFGVVERAVAPDGCCLSLLLAAPLEADKPLDSDVTACQLGYRFARMSALQAVNRDALSPHAKLRRSAEVTLRDADAAHSPFQSAHRDLGAVVMAIRCGVESLTTLSREQYDRFFRRRVYPLAWNEVALALVDGDGVTSIEVAHSGGSFALRFLTHESASCWYERSAKPGDTLTELKAGTGEVEPVEECM